MLRSAGIFLHLLQWRNVFSLRKPPQKDAARRENISWHEILSAQGARSLIYLFLATSVFAHHQNTIQMTRGSLMVRWLLQLGDTSGPPKHSG